MSIWENQVVILTLSTSGIEALKSFFSERTVEVYVQLADELGLWIVTNKELSGEIELALIRWAHFDTAQLVVFAEPPPPAKVLGFAR